MSRKGLRRTACFLCLPSKSSFFPFEIYFHFMCHVCSACMRVLCTVCLQYKGRPEEGIRSSGFRFLVTASVWNNQTQVLQKGRTQLLTAKPCPIIHPLIKPKTQVSNPEEETEGPGDPLSLPLPNVN